MTIRALRWQTFALQILAVALIFPALLFAQDELLNEEEIPIKRYNVELIVFLYQENVAVGTEIFPADEAEMPAAAIDEVPVPARTRRHPDAVGLRPTFLSEAEFTMHDVAERLELLDAYKPIMHVGWIQTGFPLQDTDPIHLGDFRARPPGLDGSFTLYLERYLHLVVDLSMDAPAEVIEIEFDDASSYKLDDLAASAGPVHYRIQEDRIVKNGEIRYFDHPKFGIVAKVSRIAKTGTSDSGESLLSRTAQ